MRTLGLDVHRRFAEVAVHDDGENTRIGRVDLENFAAFAESLGPDDHVVIESTAVTWALVEMVSRHAGKVTVSNPMKTKMIASAKVKTDKMDARVLSELGASGFVSEGWVPIPQLERCAGGSPTRHKAVARPGCRARMEIRRSAAERPGPGRRAPTAPPAGARQARALRGTRAGGPWARGTRARATLDG